MLKTFLERMLVDPRVLFFPSGQAAANRRPDADKLDARGPEAAILPAQNENFYLAWHMHVHW